MAAVLIRTDRITAYQRMALDQDKVEWLQSLHCRDPRSRKEGRLPMDVADRLENVRAHALFLEHSDGWIKHVGTMVPVRLRDD